LEKVAALSQTQWCRCPSLIAKAARNGQDDAKVTGEHVATASSGIVANSLSEVVEGNQLNFHDHSHWYQQFPWLHFSVEKQRILCFFCSSVCRDSTLSTLDFILFNSFVHFQFISLKRLSCSYSLSACRRTVFTLFCIVQFHSFVRSFKKMRSIVQADKQTQVKT